MTKLESFSKKLHADKDPAHDFLHIKRILALYEKLATSETDKELLTYAACFHGVLNQEGKIREFLRQLDLNNSRIEQIISTIRNSSSASRRQTIEGKIPYDANIINVLGAIVIAQAFLKEDISIKLFNKQ